MQIPPTYPSKPPEVYFTTKLSHPLVDISNGKLDLIVTNNFIIKKQKKFPNWEAGKNFIVKVIYFVQEIFYNPNFLQETDSYNPILGKMVIENSNQFEQEVSKLSKKSFEERFENKNKNSSLKFSKFDKYHQLILDKILKQNKDVNTYDRIEDFKNWFMNNFMEIIQNNEILNQPLNGDGK